MSGNTIGTLFTFTSFGESHGAAIGGVVDGCPPGLALCAEDLQVDLDRRKPGTSRHVTQRPAPSFLHVVSLKTVQNFRCSWNAASFLPAELLQTNCLKVRTFHVCPPRSVESHSNLRTV